VENPFNVKGKNHGHQPAIISLSQEFWVTRLWQLTRESSLHETLASAYIPLAQASGDGPLLRSIRKLGQYPEVNLEQLQQTPPSDKFILYHKSTLHPEHNKDRKPLVPTIVSWTI